MYSHPSGDNSTFTDPKSVAKTSKISVGQVKDIPITQTHHSPTQVPVSPPHVYHLKDCQQTPAVLLAYVCVPARSPRLRSPCVLSGATYSHRHAGFLPLLTPLAPWHWAQQPAPCLELWDPSGRRMEQAEKNSQRKLCCMPPKTFSPWTMHSYTS